MDDVHDAAYAHSRRVDGQGQDVPVRFDTVLVNEGAGGQAGVHGASSSLEHQIFLFSLCHFLDH